MEQPKTESERASWTGRIDKLAADKLKLPGWNAWLYEVAPQGGLFVTGAVCPPVTRGKRKGQPNYRAHDRGTKRMVYITPEELRA